VFPLSLEVRLIAWAVAAAAALGGLAWFVHHERALGASEVTAAVADQHAKDVDAARARETQIHSDQEAADHEADKFRLAAQMAARDARDAGDRLQHRFAAINAGCVPGDPAASGAGPAADDAAAVRSDVLRRVVEAARLAASAADAAHGAGLNAERDYDALTNSAAGSAP
jgi:Protein of unknown function (DUF2514)